MFQIYIFYITASCSSIKKEERNAFNFYCSTIDCILMFFFFFLWSFLRSEPPLMYSVYEGTVRVKLMDDVKITCPVQADSESELMFNWIKVSELSWE